MSPVAGGKCELKIHVGFKARIPWTERANIEVSTLWIQGLSTLAHSSCAARSSSGDAARTFSAWARSAVAIGAPRQSELKQTPDRMSKSPTVAGLSNSGGRKPVRRRSPTFSGHDACSDECRDDSRPRRRVQQREQAAGVIAIRMGKPDPAHVTRVDHLGERGDEITVRKANARVDDDRFGGMYDERVDGQDAESGYFEVVVENTDVLVRSVGFHVVSPMSVVRTGLACLGDPRPAVARRLLGRSRLHPSRCADRHGRPSGDRRRDPRDVVRTAARAGRPIR
jgi:hypothetical protein